MSTIELDTEQRRAEIIIKCGAKPIGERPSLPGGEALCWFVDPVTQSTCLLPADEITEESVTQKLNAKRLQFGMEITERVIKTNLGLRAQIRGAIRLITENRLPKEILDRAADAAFYEIVSFENSNIAPVAEMQGTES